MTRARSHRRLAGIGAFALLALVAEIVGRSLTVRFDLGRHVPTPSYAGADYYPFLLAFVKGGVALMLASLTWRFVRARSAARAARRLLAAVGGGDVRNPRVRLELSVRNWLLAFALTSGFYLVQTDSERLSLGQWPVFSPWLHTSALSVFAVLSVLVAVVYGAVKSWLADYELVAVRARAEAAALGLTNPALVWHDVTDHATPRRLFGLSFESRPPPATA
ncbi:MAG: hypothetical protein ACYDA3_08095 [Gaiellaceae bacterium]